MNLITLLQYNFYSYELRLFLKAGANIQPLFNSTKLFWKKIKFFLEPEPNLQKHLNLSKT